MSNLSMGGVQSTLTSLARINKTLNNTQVQIASGLQNPTLATDPSASTVSKSLEGSLAITKRIHSIAQQANNTLQIADTVLDINAAILNEMRAHAIQAINGTNSDLDRRDINSTFQQKLALISENAMAKWGSRTLCDGTFLMNCQTATIVKEANVVGSPITFDLDAGDLTINGQDIGAVTGNAKDMAAAINSFSGTTQVRASAITSAVGTGSFSSSAVSNPMILINGITVPLGEFAGTESSDQIVDQAVAAINAFDGLSDQNIMAQNVGGFLQINGTDGSDLSIAYRNITAQNVLGPQPTNYVGSLALSSVTSITIGGNVPGNVGLTSGVTASSGVTTVSLADMRAEALFDSALPDVSTQVGAEAALGAIDTALNKVLAERTRIAESVIRFTNLEENMADSALALQDSLAEVRDLDYPEAITEAANLEAIKMAGIAVLQTDLKSFTELGNLVGEVLRGN